MAQKVFKIQELGSLDLGFVAAALNTELRRVVLDCIDRPLNANGRKVAMIMTVKPVPDQQNAVSEIEFVTVGVEISSSIPKRQSKIFQMDPCRDGSLLFNPDLPEEPDGRTLFDDQERREDAAPEGGQ